MSKSKYPSKIDSSVELPIVRDNLIQVGSEVINSLRSAVIQIEKTLGTLPNGDESISVSDRLSRSLDELGNIKNSAVSALNLLQGPIKNEDIADGARIEESKVDLDYSTSSLYGQIVYISNHLDNIIKQVKEVSLSLAIHIDKNAVAAHLGKNIRIEKISSVISDIATLNLEIQSLEDFINEIVHKHINFSGLNISETNNSHSANQIFYDSSNTPIVSSSVQGAIDELTGTENTIIKDLKDLYFENGYLKSASITGSSGFGMLLEDNVSISYFKYTPSDDSFKTEITYSGTLVSDPKKFDYIVIDNFAYQIFKVDSSTNTIIIFGIFSANSLSSVSASIYSNPYKESNVSGFSLSPVFTSNLSFSKTIKVVNPNSTFIISDVVFPNSIDGSNSLFTIHCDSFRSLEVSTTNPSGNGIDSIVSRLNEQFCSENFPASAFRIETSGGSRICLSLDLINSAQKTYYIKLQSSNLSLNHLGFADFKDKSIYGNYGSKFHLNGEESSSLLTVLSSTEVLPVSNSNRISSEESGENFIDLGIKLNDLITIYDRGSDTGTYLVKSVTQDEITVDLKTGKLLSGTNGSGYKIEVVKNSIGFDFLVPEKLSSSINATINLDIFMTKDFDIYSQANLEYENIISGTEPLFDLFSTSVSDETTEHLLTINLIDPASPSDGLIVGIDSSEYFINANQGVYSLDIFSNTNKVIEFRVRNLSGLISSISTSPYSKNIYIIKNNNDNACLSLGSVKFDRYRQLLTGSDNFFRKIKPVKNGNFGLGNISDEFVKEHINKRYDELRSNGVVYGLEITNPALSGTEYLFSIKSGIAYVSGKRFEIKNAEITTDISSSTDSKYFIAIDRFGNVVAKAATASACSNPFSQENFTVVATVEYAGGLFSVFDLRLLISDLDFKILNEIKVSPNDAFAHFSSINKALGYAKRFSEIFPGVGTPTVKLKSGTYKININHSDNPTTRFTATSYDEVIDQDGIWIDFPVIISGEGDTTVIDITEEWSTTSGSDKYTEFENRGGIYIAGSGITTFPTKIGYGNLTFGKVILKDLSLKNSRIYLIDPKIDNGGSAFETSHEFINVTFDGNPDTGTPTEFDRQCIFLKSLSTVGINKGNFTVDRCNFLKSGIFLEGGTEFFKNIIISNNSWTALSNIYDPLISQDDISSSLIMSRSNEASNISVYSNICKSFYSASDQIICAGFANITDASPAGFSIIKNSSYFSGSIIASEDIYARDSIFSDKIEIFNTSDSSRLSNDAVYLSNSSASIGVVVRSDIEVQGNLEVDGNTTFSSTTTFDATVDINASADISGSLNIGGDLTISGTYPISCAYTARVLVDTTNTFAFFRFKSRDDDHSVTYGSATLSDAANAITDHALLPSFADGEILKITLKNISAGTRIGTLKVYKIAQGEALQLEELYVEIESISFNLFGYDSDTFNISGASFSKDDTLLFVVENTGSGTIETVMNVLIKYTI